MELGHITEMHADDNVGTDSVGLEISTTESGMVEGINGI